MVTEKKPGIENRSLNNIKNKIQRDVIYKLLIPG